MKGPASPDLMKNWNLPPLCTAEAQLAVPVPPTLPQPPSQPRPKNVRSLLATRRHASDSEAELRDEASSDNSDNIDDPLSSSLAAPATVPSAPLPPVAPRLSPGRPMFRPT